MTSQMKRSEAMALLKESVDSFQRFVVATNHKFYKQDADRANEIAWKMRQYEAFIEREFDE